MHDDAADTDGVGRMGDAQGAIPEQRPAEAPALLRAVDCRRPRTATGIGSGMLRRKRPMLSAAVIAPEASA